MSTAVKFDDELKSRIERLAAARRLTPHAIMREAIVQYVVREEERAALREDTLKAWAEFQVTGLHATADDVEAWLSTWGTEKELPAPVCHT